MQKAITNNERLMHISQERYKRKCEKLDDKMFVNKAVALCKEKCFYQIKDALAREDLVVVCNLYTMINLQELRDMAGFECEYSLLDEYRDCILEELENKLHDMGIRTVSTYLYDPYMVCTIAICCNPEMNKDELFFLGTSFTTDKELKYAMLSILISIIIAFIIKGVISILSVMYSDNLMLASGWIENVCYCIPIFVAIVGIVCYFRRCIRAKLIEWAVKYRLYKQRKKDGTSK